MVHGENVAGRQACVDCVPLAVKLDDHACREFEALALTQVLQLVVVMRVMHQEVVERLAKALLHRLGPPALSNIIPRPNILVAKADH